MAPEFKAVDINGKEYSSADFKGKIQVLDFWFTGCIPCRAEMLYNEPQEKVIPLMLLHV